MKGEFFNRSCSREPDAFQFGRRKLADIRGISYNVIEILRNNNYIIPRGFFWLQTTIHVIPQ